MSVGQKIKAAYYVKSFQTQKKDRKTSLLFCSNLHVHKSFAQYSVCVHYTKSPPKMYILFKNICLEKICFSSVDCMIASMMVRLVGQRSI